MAERPASTTVTEPNDWKTVEPNDWKVVGDQQPPISEAPGFFSSFANEAGKIAKGQIESYKHGGGGISSGGDPRQTLNETFNPFHPIQTAGYLIPQPVKDIYNAAKQGHIGEAAGKATAQAAPFVTSGISPETMERVPENVTPIATSPVRGVAKAVNAIGGSEKGRRAIGATAGAILGRPIGHSFEGMILGGALGQKLIPEFSIPGERFGLPPEPPSYDTAILPERSGPVKADTSKLGPPAGTGKYTPPERTAPVQSKVREVAPKPEQPPPMGGPQRASRLVNPMEQRSGTYQPPERIPPPVRTPIVRNTAPPEPEPAKAPQVSIPDQIATARGLGFKNLNEAINRFGFDGWQKILGQEAPKPVAEPPSVRPGSPTPFRTELTPADLMSIRNTRIPTWEEVERQGRKEQFYAQAPQVKTKAQLVNEVEPSIVAKSEASTHPYDRNLPTKRIRK